MYINTISHRLYIIQAYNRLYFAYHYIFLYNYELSFSDHVSPGPPEYIFPHSIPEDTRSTNQDKDLWFKAAVIAVPIAGGFILVLLVLLAVRMLRADTRRHRQFIEFRRERTSLTKAHLYVTDHFSEKVGRTSPFFGGMHNPLCKDPLVNNARMKKDGKLYEKVNTKPEVHRAQTPIIIWGKPSHRDFATVVQQKTKVIPSLVFVFLYKMSPVDYGKPLLCLLGF